MRKSRLTRPGGVSILAPMMRLALIAVSLVCLAMVVACAAFAVDSIVAGYYGRSAIGAVLVVMFGCAAERAWPS